MALAGEPTVLVVDDEELMRDVLQIVVEENGGKVILAADGEEAVEIFSKRHGEIDCVFLDFSMPRMNGYDVYLKFQEINPSVGIIFSSGLKVPPEVEKLVSEGKVLFLKKPFPENDLIKAVSKVVS
ncbi:MAG: response regulator [Candidatus Dadabacteria bacterium]|nr:MAG: response regulator [Candidatus Dadabacteria bacterium]